MLKELAKFLKEFNVVSLAVDFVMLLQGPTL